MMKNKQDVRGITTISLIVTIVILIILAGVSVNIVFGQNNVLEKTKEARNKTLIAGYKERIELAREETIVNNEGTITLEKLDDVLNEEDKRIWVNKTEIKDGKIILTTVDGLMFIITENTIEYLGRSNVETSGIITASMVQYTPDKSLKWTGVENVKEALDYLYSN